MDKLTQKQETFCLNLLQGMSQRDAYVAAGYSPKQLPETIDRHACELAKTDKVMARYEELRQKAEDASVATVLERKQVLTEIVRGRFADFIKNLTADKLRSAALQEIRIISYGKEVPVKTTIIKLHNPVQAIAELNKMERIYEAEGSVTIDNRTLVINVMSEKGKTLTERLMVGERTGGDNGHQDL